MIFTQPPPSPPADPSMIDAFVFYGMKWEAMYEKCLKAEAVSFSTPFAHKWEVYRNQTRIRNSYSLYSCYKNKTTNHDWQCFLLKAKNYQQQQVNNTVSWDFCCYRLTNTKIIFLSFTHYLSKPYLLQKPTDKTKKGKYSYCSHSLQER